MITINRNNAAGLRRTFENVAKLCLKVGFAKSGSKSLPN
jgi:hypothetical protein